MCSFCPLIISSSELTDEVLNFYRGKRSKRGYGQVKHEEVTINVELLPHILLAAMFYVLGPRKSFPAATLLMFTPYLLCTNVLAAESNYTEQVRALLTSSWWVQETQIGTDK